MYNLLSFNIQKIYITIFYWWSLFINCFKPINNEIEQVSLEYTLSNQADTFTIKTKFWKQEMKYWSKHSNEYWTDITSYYKHDLFEKIIKHRPKNIENYILRIKYYFNGNKYTCITRNPTKYNWPPVEQGMKFVMPIHKVYILDKLGNKISEVTKKVKKCAGPKFNFHNQKIKVRDMFDYEHALCQIIYIDGTSNMYKFDDYLNE